MEEKMVRGNMRIKCNRKWMKNLLKSGNHGNKYMWFYAVVIMLMSVILLSMVSFFCPQATAEGKVHLGLVGQWKSNYGDFKTAKILEQYAYCVTTQGIMIYDITERLLANFFSLEDCTNVEVDVDDKGMIYLYVLRYKKELLILNVDKHQNAHFIAQCDTLSYVNGIAIEGDYAYVADGPSGLQIIDIRDKSRPVI